MIKPICSLCKKELDDFGGIILSPPDDNHKVEKYHICKLCYLFFHHLENKEEVK